MKVVVDIPDSLINQVRRAVQEGEYDDSREFVNVALQNQVELELSENDPTDVVTLEEALDTDTSSNTDTAYTDGNPVPMAAASPGHGPNALTRQEYDHVTTVPGPDLDRLDPGPLWGQYNRIFPVKLTLRVLANELRNQAVHANSQVNGTGEEWVSFDRFAGDAANVAREYGLKIKQADQKHSRGQGRKLSAALPVGDDPEKSKKRFKTHFIGDIDQQGGLTGAPAHLLFVDIPVESPGLIGITDAGLEFAEEWNPLIEGGAGADQPLSNDEIRFYLEHVENQRPDEFHAMILTATAIEDGDNRPDSLTEQVATLNEDWSQSQASTVRSGIVGRMYELGLVERERVGQRGIAYQLTADGRDFHDSHA